MLHGVTRVVVGARQRDRRRGPAAGKGEDHGRSRQRLGTVRRHHAGPSGSSSNLRRYLGIQRSPTWAKDKAHLDEAIKRGDTQNAESLRNEIDGFRREWESRQ